MTYSSNHIEGSHLSHEQTRYIFETNTIAILKSGTSDSRKDWFVTSDYKRLPNVVGNNETCPPKEDT